MSVVLAVAYLGLVQVLDSREMLPPPPESCVVRLEEPPDGASGPPTV